MSSAGGLDRRVVLLQPVVARDPASGGEITSWSPLDEVWGRVVEQAQAETTDRTERVAARACSVRIRWRADVLPTMRLQVGTRVLAISGSVEAGRRRWLDIACTDFQP